MAKTSDITHHLDAATLMSFAGGSLPDALAAVAASHIEQCSACASELRMMELIGATLFETVQPSSLDKPAPTMALRRAEDTPVKRRPMAEAGGELSARIAEMVGTSDLDAVRWQWLAPGVWHRRLPTVEGDLRLLKVAPGRAMPEHGHGGTELTLMLRGSYSDETGTYRVGDVADLDSDIEHKPIADPAVGCICLIASERPARFKKLVPRLVQPLTGM